MLSPVCGIIDLGSHSVRLVLYKQYAGHWLPLYNEKANCVLGKHLAKTGALNPEALSAVEETVYRFVHLSRAWKASPLTILATAAMREAIDGKAFAEQIEKACGVPVTILSGLEETHYSASGVLACWPEAIGLFGDMGGSSLELATLENAQITPWGTYPLGVLSLQEQSLDELSKQLPAATADHFPQFIAVGGSWRSLARYYQQTRAYPLKTPHLFSLEGEALQELLAETADAGAIPKKLSGLSKDRLQLLPAASRMLSAILTRYHCRAVTFSSFGLREGYLYRHCSILSAQRDAFAIQEAIALAARLNIYHGHADLLEAWLTPLISSPIALPIRLACILSDIASEEGEGKQQKSAAAAQKILTAPLFGLFHAEKITLASLLAASYGGCDESLAPYTTLANIKTIGAALRLARTLTAGRYELLSHFPLQRQGTTLGLQITGLAIGETAQRRWKDLLQCIEQQ